MVRTTKWRGSQRSVQFVGWVVAMSEFIVPERARDRIETLTARRRDAWIVAAFLVVAAVGGLALWSRGGAAAIAPPAAPPEPPAAAADDQTAAASESLFVHVAGAVRRPGLYELQPGSRVADALDAARGALPRADLDLINLAESVTD